MTVPASSPTAWVTLLHAEVAWTLEQADVDALLIKGLSTGRWLFERGDRPCADVDVLVAPGCVEAAATALAGRGFEPVHRDLRPDEPAAHSRVLRRSDGDLGGHEVDLHVRLPGAEGDPSKGWAAVWGRRQREEVAGQPVWLPDLSTRALLVANQTARDGARRERAVADLRAALSAVPESGWAEVAALARSVGMQHSLRAGLEVLPQGREVAARVLSDVQVPQYWRLRAAGAHRTATRLVELASLPWSQRLDVVARTLVPSPAMMRLRDPDLASHGRAGLAAAYLRRLGQGAKSLPRAVREVRALHR